MHVRQWHIAHELFPANALWRWSTAKSSNTHVYIKTLNYRTTLPPHRAASMLHTLSHWPDSRPCQDWKLCLWDQTKNPTYPASACTASPLDWRRSRCRYEKRLPTALTVDTWHFKLTLDGCSWQISHSDCDIADSSESRTTASFQQRPAYLLFITHYYAWDVCGTLLCFPGAGLCGFACFFNLSAILQVTDRKTQALANRHRCMQAHKHRKGKYLLWGARKVRA